jgi:hypothetical protein
MTSTADSVASKICACCDKEIKWGTYCAKKGVWICSSHYLLEEGCKNCECPKPDHSEIEGIYWGPVRYSTEPCTCGESDCSGQECSYNALCAGGCNCVLNKDTYIYCLEREGTELTICSHCYGELNEIMTEEGGWKVDGKELEPEEEE